MVFNFVIFFLKIISLESWVTIMYYIQDAHSFWNWVYFVFLIVVSIVICFLNKYFQFENSKFINTFLLDLLFN